MNVITPASKPQLIEKYGTKWPVGTLPIKIELWAYLKDHTPEKGGLGKEQHFRNAFRLAWPKFIWHDWMELSIQGFCHERFLTVIGHTRATKTYGFAHFFYLDYCAAPFETWTSLTTVTFDGLKSRMWSDLMAGVETASFACPFKISSSSNEMKLRVSEKGRRRDEKFMIEGFATANTSNAPGRIQGKHANRRRLGLDEAQELPDAIFTAETNAGSAPNFISARLANPVDKMSKFGRECCEPAGGWSSIHDSDLYWRTKAGHLVLHFDGLQCHNSKLWVRFDRGEITKAEYEAKKLPFMLSHEYIEEVRAQKGEDSLEWWMYIRGFFPGDGIVSRAFTELILSRMAPDITFDFRPEKFFILDPAYESDDCVGHIGEFGAMRDGLIGAQLLKTIKVPIKVMDGERTKDEQIAEFVIAACKEHGVKPENYIQDTTGNGRSVYSHVSKEWSRQVQGVEFGGKPTKRQLSHAEPKECEELYCYFVDELHFRMAEWAKSGRIGGIGNLDPLTLVDLGSRRYTVKDKKRRIESKKELKKRLGRSPDYGDAFILLGELLAKKGYMPGKTLEPPKAGSAWSVARKNAIKACVRYRGEDSFAHF